MRSIPDLFKVEVNSPMEVVLSERLQFLEISVVVVLLQKNTVKVHHPSSKEGYKALVDLAPEIQ